MLLLLLTCVLNHMSNKNWFQFQISVHIVNYCKIRSEIQWSIISYISFHTINISYILQFSISVKRKKLSLQQTAEAYRVVRTRGSHNFYNIDSQMAMKLSALRAGRPQPQEDSWYSFLLEAVSTPVAFSPVHNFTQSASISHSLQFTIRAVCLRGELSFTSPLVPVTNDPRLTLRSHLELFPRLLLSCLDLWK
jgi:hypothetical protein